MKRKKKLDHAVFRKAARRLQRQLDKSDTWGAECCCTALAIAMNIDTSDVCDLRSTSEFKLFKQLFGMDYHDGDFWFGDTTNNRLRPHKRNQKKRIKALLLACEEAKRINKNG